MDETLGLGGGYRCAAYVILTLPLFSFLVNGLWLGRKRRVAAGWFATACMAVVAGLSLWLAWGYHDIVLAHREAYPGGATVLWEHTWLAIDAAGGLAAKAGCLLDPISVMMLVVVSVISFLVHFYSMGYMRDDAGGGRFFALLSLFTFSMLGLVVATNLVQIYFFWELVGVSSYLLIGFWYKKPSAVAASKKAFILTRFADAFFLVGLLWTGAAAGSFDFQRLNAPATIAALNHGVVFGGLSFNLVTVLALLIYMGAWGKSAMFPLHVWLPDAMEGPTPVSSLIHSATMVVAGVYLVARMFPLFSGAETALRVVEATGAFTALFAAVVACAQTDIKRILAFSTLSQLGYMMLALGVSGLHASMFHVFTHAFFKCLLFLSAGLVIHASHSNHVNDAGGLRRRLPLTYAATWIACLAISGVWPFAGFFSKEQVLSAAWNGGHLCTFAMALTVGGLTAFYMFRLLFLVFHGPAQTGNHGNTHVTSHSAEDALMTLPVLVLAVPSAAIGWLSEGIFTEGLRPGPAWLPVATSMLAAAGLLASAFLYVWKRRLPRRDPAGSPVWYRAVANKFYVDELYLAIVRGVLRPVAGLFSEGLERKGLNRGFDALSAGLRKVGGLVNRIQNGQVQVYAAASASGLALLLLFLLIWNHAW